MRGHFNCNHYFIFDGVNLLYYKCHKINFKYSSSYIDSLDWIKIKKEAINPRNCDGKCFQYAGTVALNCEEIGRHLERVSNIKPFINKHNWEGIKYLSGKDDLGKFEKNNSSVALDVLYKKEMKICQAYISKYSSTQKKQITVLMILMKKVGIILQ